MSLAIDFSWADGSVVQGPDRHAWADVSIKLGELNLDAVDMRLRVIQSRFTTSLLPLCEWLIESWPRLLEERALVMGAQRRGWESCHSFRFGRGGGPMPDVVLRRIDESTMELTAREDQMRPPGISLSFLVNAQIVARADNVARELARVIDGVAERMRGNDDWTFDHLSERWALARTPAALTAGRLGFSLDQFEALGEDELEALQELMTAPSLLRVAEASPYREIRKRLTHARAIASVFPGDSDLQPETATWRSVRLRHDTRATPWAQGWRAAEQFRAVTAFSEHPPGRDLAKTLETKFGWEAGKQLRAGPASVDGIDMIVVRPEGKMPTTVTWVPTDQGKRFRMAKTLFYALCGRGEALAVDSVCMPEHSVANAFAAELLAPRAFIAMRAPAGGVWTEPTIASVARECAVDPRVIENQIKNRDLGVLA